jgi:hypothetical protein
MGCSLFWATYSQTRHPGPNKCLGDFRGTKDSLKQLVNDDRFRKPLLRDIWFFYRAERLYLLQVQILIAPLFT